MGILAVVGGQYGSEGKGVIVASIADEYDCHVRTGGPQAGHSFYHDDKKWVQQSIPCGWINPVAELIIGPGALVSVNQFMKEFHAIEAAGYQLKGRLHVDANAGILEDDHHYAEGGVNGELHQRIGSTGEGVGAARLGRIQRDPQKFRRIGDARHLPRELEDCVYHHTSRMVQYHADSGDEVLLEGTQGASLSLIHGPWPYVTSADTNSAQLAVDAGIPPRLVDRCLLVCRSYPIRVHGNSGPLNGELTWEQMGERLGRRAEERTTVTKKVRRIGAWDDELIRTAIMLNKPTSIALTFADYVDPEVSGMTRYADLSPKVRALVEQIEFNHNTPISIVGTGGNQWQTVRRTLEL